MTGVEMMDVPASPPAVGEAVVPTSSVVVAVLVLAAAALAVQRIHRRETRGSTGAVARAQQGSEWLPSPDDEASRREAVAFFVALGVAMVDSGAAVTQVTATLRRVAQVNGVAGLNVAVLPTVLFVSVPGAESVQTSIASAGRGLRLDQVDEVFQVVDAAEHGDISPEEGRRLLAATRRRRPRGTAWSRLAGYPLLAAGLVLILRGSWTELLLGAVLAAVVGALQLHRSEVPAAYQLFLPVFSALFASVTVFALVRAGADIGVFAPLIACLVTFLPGAQLTTGVIELATGQMVAGAGRVAHGVMQLVLLAIGVVAGAQLVGIPAHTVTSASLTGFGVVAPWLGVVAFGVGVVLANSARISSLPWILLILGVAYAGQVLGDRVLGDELSAFAGALLMTPVAMFAADQRTGPPTLVTFLPAFWMLVPGAAGLAGLTKYLGDRRFDGVTSLISAGSTMVGIAFGVLLGLAAGSVIGLRSGVSLRDDAD